MTQHLKHSMDINHWQAVIKHVEPDDSTHWRNFLSVRGEIRLLPHWTSQQVVFRNWKTLDLDAYFESAFKLSISKTEALLKVPAGTPIILCGEISERTYIRDGVYPHLQTKLEITDFMVDPHKGLLDPRAALLYTADQMEYVQAYNLRYREFCSCLGGQTVQVANEDIRFCEACGL